LALLHPLDNALPGFRGVLGAFTLLDLVAGQKNSKYSSAPVSKPFNFSSTVSSAVSIMIGIRAVLGDFRKWLQASNPSIPGASSTRFRPQPAMPISSGWAAGAGVTRAGGKSIGAINIKGSIKNQRGWHSLVK